MSENGRPRGQAGQERERKRETETEKKETDRLLKTNRHAKHKNILKQGKICAYLHKLVLY